jgi:hypothetical protein
MAMEMSRTLISLAFAAEDVSWVQIVCTFAKGVPGVPLEQPGGKLTFLGHFVGILGAQMMSFDIIAIAA